MIIRIYFRRRSETKIEYPTVVKSEEMDEDDIEEEDENMKPFCCNICARGFHCKCRLKWCLVNEIIIIQLKKN